MHSKNLGCRLQETSLVEVSFFLFCRELEKEEEGEDHLSASENSRGR